MVKLWAKRIAVGVAILIAFLYVADFAIWRVRFATGSGMGSVEVDQVIATPLKGNKEEYDYTGTVQMPCSQSLFPHGGAKPCWWLSRHTTQEL